MTGVQTCALPIYDKKQKVTFSINEKLNELLDNQVEKEGMKKSQLIEKILKEHFNKITFH